MKSILKKQHTTNSLNTTANNIINNNNKLSIQNNIYKDGGNGGVDIGVGSGGLSPDL